MPATPERIHSDEELALCKDFAEFRHNLLNSLAITMALAEMGRRDPTKFDRLADIVLEKGELIRSEMMNLTTNFNKVLAPPPSTRS
jgi:hypothetical protein